MLGEGYLNAANSIAANAFSKEDVEIAKNSREDDMFSLKKSLVAVVGVLVLVGTIAAVMPLISRGQVGNNPLTRDLRKSYYLTKTQHNGSQVLSACAAGFHTASITELLQTSNLRYDTVLGETTQDSGFGAPTDLPSFGWIRTGFHADNSDLNGRANCNAWTSTSGVGTGVQLLSDWDSPATNVSPWNTVPASCGGSFNVWCVEE